MPYRFKQVIVVRKDLGMSKGKLAVQACHASLEAYRIAKDRYPRETKMWLREGGKKVAVYVETKAELFELKERILDKVPRYVVIDAGLTELEPGTITCMGLGPYYEADLDKYTGSLKLVG